MTDPNTGLVNYWVAPAKFTGDVSIASASTTLVHSLPANVADYPQLTFTTRTLSLNDLTPWRVGDANGALATNAQIQSVLGAVTSLRIRGEYSLQIDTNDPDNVMLRDASPVPEPGTAVLVLGGAALLAGWSTRQRGGARPVGAV